MDSTIRSIIKKIALKHKLRESEVEKIYKSQFKRTAQTIREGVPGKPETFKNVLIPKFGKFLAKKNRLRIFNDRNTEN